MRGMSLLLNDASPYFSESCIFRSDHFSVIVLAALRRHRVGPISGGGLTDGLLDMYHDTTRTPWNKQRLLIVLTKRNQGSQRVLECILYILFQQIPGTVALW